MKKTKLRALLSMGLAAALMPSPSDSTLRYMLTEPLPVPDTLTLIAWLTASPGIRFFRSRKRSGY